MLGVKGKLMLNIKGLYTFSTKIDLEDVEKYWHYLLFQNNGEVILVGTTESENCVAS